MVQMEEPMAAIQFRQQRVRRWWYLGATITALAFFTVFWVAASSANLAGSTFEGNDGNLVVNTAGNHDWDNAPNLSVGVDLPTGQNDNSFGQGTKEDDTSVTVVAGSIPNSKADLARFAVAGEVINGQTFMYLAWSRENQSGTVNFDFELNKLAQPDLTTPGPKTLNRSVNDVLINYAFQGGSNTPTLTKYHWSGSAWVNDGAIASACEEGATNSAPVSENLGGNPAVTRPAQQFGEAAINMTCAGIIPQGACESFGSGYVKSRSSTSFTSEIKDFIAPVGIHFSNCGKLTIIKHTDPAGLDQNFSYSTTGGLSPATFTLNDGTGKVNTQVYPTLQPGTYTVTEGSDPTGFAFESLSCTGAGGTSSGETATAVITGGSDITCTYINKQQLGAIKITKTGKDKNCTAAGTPSITNGVCTGDSVAALSGGVFSIKDSNGNPVTGSPATTGSDGTVCVGSLPFGTYSVQETQAPNGYSIDDATSHNVSVSANSTCGDGHEATFSAGDSPLTNLTVNVASQASGATNSTITCVNSTNAGIGNSPQGPGDPETVTANGLKPGTYSCTVVIDP
jgi:Prealbumin-like fold domain